MNRNFKWLVRFNLNWQFIKLLHSIFFCILSISSCKPVNDTKPEDQSITQDTTQNTAKIQNEPANTTEGFIKIQFITLDCTSKKGVFLDSIQLYICDSNDGYESFFHFYYKGKRYTQEIYFSDINDHFTFAHMNKDKYLDIIYKNTANTGQGCLSQDIFIFDSVSKKYMRNGPLSIECYLSYNHKYDVYSGYSRGSGQGGPWIFQLYKFKNDSLYCFESLYEEKIVTCIDSLGNKVENSLCNNPEISWKYTHYCHGDSTVYKNLDKSEVFVNMYMSEYYDPSARCQFMNQTK